MVRVVARWAHCTQALGNGISGLMPPACWFYGAALSSGQTAMVHYSEGRKSLVDCSSLANRGCSTIEPLADHLVPEKAMTAPHQHKAAQRLQHGRGQLSRAERDTFTLLYKNNGEYEEVPLMGKGIAWWTDYNIKYQNPSNENLSLSKVFEGTEKPKNWPNHAYNLSSDPYNNGFINEDFLVWMRTAALPNFRKLYRRIESGNFTEGLRAGEYMIKIAYNYPVVSFGGQKKVVFSSVSWMGGKNPFLGIAYLVVGALCTLVAIIMLIVFIKYQGKNNDDDDI